MLTKKILQLLSVLLLPAFVMAQVTTSSISGIIKTSKGELLTGATVTATHVPTGTVYTTTARAGGRYSINNVQPGGPYTIEVTYVGYEKQKREDIYLNLGETGDVSITVGETAQELNAVVVSGVRKNLDFGGKGGSETIIGRDKMENLPTVGRNLTDYLRATPQLKLTSGAYNDGGFSIAGQNNRFNAFYVDGSVNNDVFGLAASGTNGGQSGVSPISIDAIDQFQVVISPYNASLGNFTGGAVNAITKSGTNTFHGSAYYVFRNQDLAGKTPTGEKSDATKLSAFSNKTYGFTFGGPLVKNKLFYFISAELQRDQTPNPFDFSTYTGDTKDINAINNLVSVVKSRGYDVGPGFQNNTWETKADRISAKVDWNIDPKNKLTVSYRYNKGNKIFPYASTNNQIEFYNAGYVFPTKTNSASLELKSNTGKSASNRLLATFTNVTDDRDIIGQPAPSVSITDGSGTIYFGPDGSSVYNYLSQKNFNILDHYKFNLGKHYFTVGFEAEYYKAANAFVQYIYGDYQYDSVAQFLKDMKPRQYRANFNLVDNKPDNQTNGAAKFNVAREAFFINDEIQFNENFNLSLGLRADLYQFITTPVADRFAIDSAMPVFSQYYDLKGAAPGQKPRVPISLSPRIGFTYKIPEENVTVRGGIGLFAGRIPLVWPGGIYNNTGITSGGYTLSRSNNSGIWNQDLIRYRTNAYTPQEIGFNQADAKGSLNLISKDFKMPKVLRTSIAVDKNWGSGWTTSVEGIFTKNINDVYYYNINIVPPSAKMAGPDNRNVYPSPNTVAIRSSGVLNPYSGAYLLTNADGEKGFAYNFTVTLNKTSRTGFNFYLAYNYGDSYVLNESQSSTNGSQWGSQETVNGRNFLTRSRSDNSVGHRIFSVLSKKFTYAHKKMATTVSLTYTGQTGQPFSYVSSGQLVSDGQAGYDLVYIPTADQLQSTIFLPNKIGDITYTPDQQKAALEAYIQNDKYLVKHRGLYAERNGSRLPFTNLMDLKVAQDFTVKLGKSNYTFQVAYSMFNFTNFLNRKWGRQYYQGTDQVALLSFAGYVNSTTDLTPQYRFNPTLGTPGAVSITPIPSYSSRWISQLEFRIRF